MGVISRGIKNTFRNGLRTFSIIVILALSIGLAVTMFIARGAVGSKIASVKGSIGNIITISPAGARGFEGGGEPLTTDELNKVKALPHVVSVIETLNDRLASTDTNLQSAIAAGTLGNRQGRFNNGGRAGGNFTPPIQVIGTTDPTSLQTFGGGIINLKSGTIFDPTIDKNVAVIGLDLATKNNLAVGSNFQAYGAGVNVVGIFDSGNTFSNSVIVMPLTAVQRLSSQAGDVSSAIAQVDSIANLDSAVMAIKTTLGSGADVVSQQDTSSQALAPLENIRKVSLLSTIGAAIAAAFIILLTMLMIVRERRREIGVLKAIGASNAKVIGQFMTESVTFTLISAVVGVGLGVMVSNPVISALVNSASTSSSNVGGGNGGPSRAAGQALRFLGQSGTSLRNIHAIIGWNIVLEGLVAAVVIAVIGSVIPAWLIAHVRPSEAMRSE